MDKADAGVVASYLNRIPELVDEAAEELDEEDPELDGTRAKLGGIKDKAVTVVEMLGERSGEFLYEESHLETQGDPAFEDYICMIGDKMLKAHHRLERYSGREDDYMFEQEDDQVEGFDREFMELDHMNAYLANIIENHDIDNRE